MSKTFIAKISCVFSVAWAAAAHADPVPLHAYELNGSFADSGSGGAISIESGGGILGASTYRFNPTAATESSATRGDNNPDGVESYNQGLTLRSSGSPTLLSNPGVYSIEMRFQLDSIPNITPDPQPWVKLIDFKNRSTDDGFYTEDSSSFDVLGQSAYIEYFGGAGGFSEDPVVLPNQWFHLVLTRNAAGQVNAYANGVLAFNATDTTGALIFSGPDGVMRFLQDDLASPNYIRDYPTPPFPPQTDVFESTPGVVDFLRIYDTTLSASDVADLFANLGMKGDMNDDGVVNGFDTQPFEIALADPAGYLATYPTMTAEKRDYRGDINADAAFDGFDTQPFEGLIAGGGGMHAVPEPSTFALLALGALGLAFAHRHRPTKK